MKRDMNKFKDFLRSKASMAMYKEFCKKTIESIEILNFLGKFEANFQNIEKYNDAINEFLVNTAGVASTIQIMILNNYIDDNQLKEITPSVVKMIEEAIDKMVNETLNAANEKQENDNE